jgi:hypothetical protein
VTNDFSTVSGVDAAEHVENLLAQGAYMAWIQSSVGVRTENFGATYPCRIV